MKLIYFSKGCIVILLMAVVVVPFKIIKFISSWFWDDFIEIGQKGIVQSLKEAWKVL